MSFEYKLIEPHQKFSYMFFFQKMAEYEELGALGNNGQPPPPPPPPPPVTVRPRTTLPKTMNFVRPLGYGFCYKSQSTNHNLIYSLCLFESL